MARRRQLVGSATASQVWETYIGEGMSRFLAVYYGDYQEVLSDLLESHPELTASDPAIGPIRQIRWEYDPDRGTYLRSQDQADGSGVLVPSFDRLSGDRLQADNVLVLFAEHKYQTLQGTILSIELAYVPKRFGLLFRDGRQYEIQWSSPGLEFRVQDDRGRPVPLKPGVTFFEVVSFESSWDPAARIVRFHNPPLPTLTMTLTPTPTATITPSATDSVVPPTGTATP